MHDGASITCLQEGQFATSTAKKGMPATPPRTPNGLPISRRERTTKTCQKPNDLGREAVGCNGVFGAPVSVSRVADRMGRPHPHGITLGTTSVHLYHAHRESRPA